jgi:hypothetical protein
MIWLPILLVTAVFIGLPLILNQNNAQYLLSGYNTMTDEQRANFDLTGYLKFLKRSFPILGIVVLLQFLVFYVAGVKEYGIIGMLGVVCLGLPPILIKAQKFDHNNSKSKRIVIYVLSGVLIAVFVAVSIGFYYSAQPTNLTITSDQIIISGSYGEEIQLEQLVDYRVVSTLPEIKMKINGFALAGNRKGKFKSKSGVINVYQNTENDYFLLLKTEKHTYYCGGDSLSINESKLLLDRLINPQISE